MIVHIFTGERYHLVPKIAKGFITTYAGDAQHRILLFGDKKMDKRCYDQMFKELGYTDYSFCTSKINLISYLWKNRKNTILLHGEMGFYIIVFLSYLFGFQCINWICWGSAANIAHGRKSVVVNPIKVFIYNRLYSIITLMEDDRLSIIKDFKYPSNKIQTISYASDGEQNDINRACAKIRMGHSEKYDKIRVLLGNNPGNLPYYNQLIDFLSSFKGRIELHCMMNYSVVRNQQYDIFISHGKAVFGNDFYSDEDYFTEAESYSRYMNSYDIYICGNPNQTGLGALYTMLQLGKKIYVTGKNYCWLKDGIGSIIFEISSISEFDDFVRPISKEEKDFNIRQILDFEKKAPDQWHKYLREIDR